MKENQLLGTFLAKEGLNLSGMRTAFSLGCRLQLLESVVADVGSGAPVSAQIRGRCVTCADPLFMAESTNPFSEPMAPWSFDFSHAVASAITVCVPCLVQGFLDSLKKMHCAQTAPSQKVTPC